MAVGNVRREPPYGASTSLIGWLAGDAWVAAAGEYAFYNAGARLEDLPTGQLVEIAYFLLRRELLDNVRTKEEVDARQKAMTRLDNALLDAEMDDEFGLPSWVTQSGIAAADGSTPFT